ncbi:uncharacterized protein BKA55DRAFT_581520 [Fusarium redolens]|uniref:Uncharacterized protein n=1 Tax=Fusarium redolens TaxID=48865 RepID=A0A9P9JNX8_FUSRE|nr:uncharacterized protein BKA55DRAFT_581520 [Fusarium redolens]KAH7231703.1 hypothetical protein BKA55DRAFT_581520 [Fusarium redolens]
MIFTASGTNCNSNLAVYFNSAEWNQRSSYVNQINFEPKVDLIEWNGLWYRHYQALC